MEMWSAQAGIKMQQIPYRGGAPAVMATVAGQTQITLMSPLAALSQIKAGNLRPLATGNTTRDKLFPDIPTMGEVGYPSVVAVQWIGLLTTGGTPQPIIERLNAVINDALKDPALVKKLGDQGVTAVGGTSQQFKKVIATELNNWKAPAKRANIVAE
jgi:tripartite-type tricarboxylate transporter receptor subunit TctC